MIFRYAEISFYSSETNDWIYFLEIEMHQGFTWYAEHNAMVGIIGLINCASGLYSLKQYFVHLSFDHNFMYIQSLDLQVHRNLISQVMIAYQFTECYHYHISKM